MAFDDSIGLQWKFLPVLLDLPGGLPLAHCYCFSLSQHRCYHCHSQSCHRHCSYILLCPEEGRIEVFLLATIALEQWLDEADTDPKLTDCIVEYVQ